MKVITVHAMQDLDRLAIEEFGIPSLKLMEQAGHSCVETIMTRFEANGSKHVVVLAGPGNNGGDGYVVARLLKEKNWEVKVLILADHDRISGDAAINLDRLSPSMIEFCPHEDQLTQHENVIRDADLIVDALLGTGLRSDVSGAYRKAIALINESGRPVLSVDIPSGIHGTTGRVMGDAVRATVTVTFAFAKLGHILYPGAAHTGKLIIADIGIPRTLMDAASGFEILDAAGIRPMLKRRDRLAHKGTFGHCLIIAGSTGKTGAAAMSANSAVRAGSGLVTVAVAESLHQILEIKTTEAMTVPLPDSGSGYLTNDAFPAIEKLLIHRDAVALGPGLDRRPGTLALVQKLVESIATPLVIDADGLNALADDITVLRRTKSPCIILTPHAGEMGRLLGASVPDAEAVRISVAQDFARNFGVYLVLKGARTIIASPDGIAAINSSGNPGMATGGMGDVLTGILVSLLGQGYSPWDACRSGVFLHGYAADIVAETKGEIGMNATDVQEALPYAYERLLNQLVSKSD